MRIIIAAGGTGGHIYPGIAVAREVCRRDKKSEILFVGSERGLEKRIVPENGFEVSLINSAGLKNVGFAGKIKGMMVLPVSFFEARKIIKGFRPDVVVGAGGYVSGPVLLTASLMRIPTLVMDSNALPGFTNRQLARFVDKAAVAFEDAIPYFGEKAIVTGNPVRREFFGIRPKTGPRDEFSVLVFGGSQGSRAINSAMVDALAHLSNKKDRLKITHQTGEADLENVAGSYRGNSWNDADVRSYINDMVAEFEKADLIIARAGATTCAEVAAAGKASILIPLPTAADDHQRKNAEAMQNAGAAKMILQKDLDGATLAHQIESFIDEPEKAAAMGRAARKMAKEDAAKATVDLIEELSTKG